MPASRSGYIDIDELEALFEGLGKEPPESFEMMLNDIDEDSSGHIDFDEFCLLLHKYALRVAWTDSEVAKSAYFVVH